MKISCSHIIYISIIDYNHLSCVLIKSRHLISYMFTCFFLIFFLLHSLVYFVLLFVFFHGQNSTLSKIPALQGSTKSPRCSSACPSTTKRATFSDSLFIQPTSAGSTDRLPYSESGNKVRQQANQRCRKEHNLGEGHNSVNV